VQVDPIKPVLKAPGSMQLKLRYNGPLSNFAVNFNFSRYIKHYASDIIAVLDAEERTEPVVIIGQSYGGFSVLRTAVVGRCRLTL